MLARFPCNLAPSLLAAALCALAGCDSTAPRTRPGLFESRSPRDAMLVALSDEDADLRREAVTEVGDSPEVRQDWAIDGLITIALLELDTQTRSYAIRNLARTADPRAAEACLKLLAAADFPPQQVRPVEALCRWDAAESLAALCGRPADVEPGLAIRARDGLLRTLRDDPDRNVRIAAARGLAGFPDLPTLRGLIAALADRDFAVVHAAEGTLAELTGHTHNCDPHAWEQWLAANESQAFAKAGQLPESRRPPYDNAFEKRLHDARQSVRWLFPGSKP